MKRVFKVVKYCLAAVLCGAIVFCALLLEPSVKINSMKELDTEKLSEIKRDVIIKDRANNPITDDVILNNRIYCPISELPQYLTDAFVCVEDERFFQHNGVDYYRILGASLRNFKAKKFAEGASTISQQLIKNTHLSGEKKLKRKINEIRLAIDLERRYKKDEILEMYLNVIYFGNNVYGIGAAAKTYFNKPAANLSLNESAFLAGVINNPHKYNPLSRPDAANERRKTVLKRMFENDKITESEYRRLREESVITHAVCGNEQYSGEIVSEAAAALGIKRNEFLRGDYVIKTYFDPELQQRVNKIIADYKFQEKDNAIVQIMVMSRDGEVIANCSNARQNLSNFKRQPGSLIKPIISYAPALEKGIISPISPVYDTHSTFGDYSPSNYKGVYLGWISAMKALSLSQNIPAVKLTDTAGIEYCKKTAERFGLKFGKNDNGLSIALGGTENGYTLKEIANAYQVFANDGEYIKASHIKSISDRNGNLLYVNEKAAKKAVGDDTAFMINYMLSDCAANGTAKRIGFGAAKTGTVGSSAGNTDAGVIAYSPTHIVAVRLSAKSGCFSNGIGGGTHPCELAKKVLQLLPQKNFVQPSSIVWADIDKTEYYANNKIVLAAINASHKDKIRTCFSKRFLPTERAEKPNDFIINMDRTIFDNYIIIP